MYAIFSNHLRVSGLQDGSLSVKISVCIPLKKRYSFIIAVQLTKSRNYHCWYLIYKSQSNFTNFPINIFNSKKKRKLILWEKTWFLKIIYFSLLQDPIQDHTLHFSYDSLNSINSFNLEQFFILCLSRPWNFWRAQAVYFLQNVHQSGLCKRFMRSC